MTSEKTLWTVLAILLVLILVGWVIARIIIGIANNISGNDKKSYKRWP